MQMSINAPWFELSIVIEPARRRHGGARKAVARLWYWLCAAGRRALAKDLADLDGHQLADTGLRPDQVPRYRRHPTMHPLAVRDVMDTAFWPGFRA